MTIARGAGRRLAVAVGCLLAASASGAAARATSSGTTSTTVVSTVTWTSVLGGNASTFDSSVGGWSGVWGGSVARVSTPVLAGAGALAVRSTSTSSVPMLGARSALQPATAGRRYAAQAWVRAGTVSRRAAVVIGFYGSSGGVLDAAWGQPVADSSSAWTRTYRAVGIAPPGTTSVAALVLWGNVGPGERHYVDSVTLTDSAGPAPAVAGPLHTSGNRIYDVHGSPVVLRGMYRWGLESDVSSAGPSQDDIAHAKAWGANVVRIGLGEPYWLTTSCHFDPNYVSKVDAVVDWVTSRGMVAILDLHWNTPTSCGTPGQQPMADYPGSVAFWTQVATRYRNNPLVAFDLYNEPHDVSDAVWRNGGPVTSGGVTFEAAGMQQLYDAVRSTGATNLVFVSGTNWANAFPTTAPLAGENIVYAVHAYTCPWAVTNCVKPDPLDPSSILGGWVVPGQTYPVMVTEFGWPDPADGRYIANVIAYAGAHGWGFATFSWGDTTWGEWDLLQSAGTGTNYMPKPTGASLLYGLAANG